MLKRTILLVGSLCLLVLGLVLISSHNIQAQDATPEPPVDTSDWVEYEGLRVPPGLTVVNHDAKLALAEAVDCNEEGTECTFIPLVVKPQPEPTTPPPPGTSCNGVEKMSSDINTYRIHGSFFRYVRIYESGILFSSIGKNANDGNAVDLTLFQWPSGSVFSFSVFNDITGVESHCGGTYPYEDPSPPPVTSCPNIQGSGGGVAVSWTQYQDYVLATYTEVPGTEYYGANYYELKPDGSLGTQGQILAVWPKIEYRKTDVDLCIYPARFDLDGIIALNSSAYKLERSQ